MGFLNKKLTKNYYPGGFPDPNPYPDDVYVYNIIIWAVVALAVIGCWVYSYYKG